MEQEYKENRAAVLVGSSAWLVAQVGRRVRQRINGKRFVITGFSRSPNSGKARFHLFSKRVRRLVLVETVVNRWMWDVVATNEKLSDGGKTDVL